MALSYGIPLIDNKIKTCCRAGSPQPTPSGTMPPPNNPTPTPTASSSIFATPTPTPTPTTFNSVSVFTGSWIPLNSFKIYTEGFSTPNGLVNWPVSTTVSGKIDYTFYQGPSEGGYPSRLGSLTFVPVGYWDYTIIPRRIGIDSQITGYPPRYYRYHTETGYQTYIYPVISSRLVNTLPYYAFIGKYRIYQRDSGIFKRETPAYAMSSVNNIGVVVASDEHAILNIAINGSGMGNTIANWSTTDPDANVGFYGQYILSFLNFNIKIPARYGSNGWIDIINV